MLFNLFLLLFILFFLFSYFNIKLDNMIKDFDYAFLFWILFFVTILTVIEIIFCFMMWFKYKNKQGDIGPRGFQGYPGPKGDNGKCDDECQINLLTLLFIRTFEKDKTLTTEKKKYIKNNLKKIDVNIYRLTNYDVNNIIKNLNTLKRDIKTELEKFKDNNITATELQTVLKTLII